VDDFLEIKRHKNKPDQQFRCTLLHMEPGHAVLRYVSDEPGRIADMHIAPGSTTVAHYWTNRPYVVWRMFNARTILIGTLFHICTDVQIFDHHLSYADLLLDIWIAPDGSVRILDEDEVQACAADGRISAVEFENICMTRNDILKHHSGIIAELAEFERARPPHEYSA